MSDKLPNAAPSADSQTVAQQTAPLKNHNPNQRHNTKKVSLGPNTKR